MSDSLIRESAVSTTSVSHPGYSWCYGSTGAYIDPPAPFFWCSYDPAPFGSPTIRHFGYADTLDEAKRRSGA